MKKKVLLIHRSLGLGGAEKVFAFVANSLSEKYETKVLLLSIAEKTLFLNESISIVIRDCYSNRPIIGKNMLKGLSDLKKMAAVIMEESNLFAADLIICFDLRIILAIGLVRKKIWPKVIFSERADPYENPKYWAIILKYLYRKVDFIVFQTEQARDFYGNTVAKKNEVIPNPAFARIGISQKFDIHKRKPYIFSAGRFQRRKGFDILVTAFSKVCADFPKYSLILYGEGEEEPLIKKKINELGIGDRVILKKSENGVVEKNREATLFVLPSRSEGIPNILIEAMIEEIPSVAADCSPGGAKMLSNNGEYCLLANNNDANSLAEMISEALGNPNRMDRMAQLAKKSLDRFEPSKISKCWVEVVDKVMQEL